MRTLILSKVRENDIICKMDELLISINRHMQILTYTRIENDDEVIYGFLRNRHYDIILNFLNDDDN